MVEREEALEELVVKLDLVGNALSDIHLPANEGGARDDEATELELVASMEAPALRTVLWSLLDGFAELEFQKRMREACVRRKDAEAAAAAEKHQKLEQHTADLRRGFHERLSVLHSERIEFAQAVCSPVGKKQGQLSALHAMNSDLEVHSACLLYICLLGVSSPLTPASLSPSLAYSPLSHPLLSGKAGQRERAPRSPGGGGEEAGRHGEQM